MIVAPKKERRENFRSEGRGFQKGEGRGNYNRGKKSSVVYKDRDDAQTEGNERKSGNRTYGYRTFGYTRREETVATSKHNFDTVDDHGFHETEDIED